MEGRYETHIPVLLDACIEGLCIRPEGTYLDGTLGRAGHAREIARRLTTGRLIGIDRDDAALQAAPARLAGLMDRVTLVQGNFSELAELLDGLGVGGVDGMLFDLGVSSPQLDDPARGFSYMHDAPLDMRMTRDAPLTAYTVVNEWPREELRRILQQYGEERHAGLIAAALCRRRELSPIETTGQLVDSIKSAMPAAALRERQHPAKRSFQAIRMAVNEELESIERMLTAAVPRLNPGGRLALISFHSLEDRAVKRSFQHFAAGCTCPPDFPVCVCHNRPKLRILTKKPIVPSAEQCEENPRARSAKLRLAEKIEE